MTFKGFLFRWVVLIIVASAGQKTIEAVSGESMNEAASWVLWGGLAAVFALIEPKPPEGRW